MKTLLKRPALGLSAGIIALAILAGVVTLTVGSGPVGGVSAGITEFLGTPAPPELFFQGNFYNGGEMVHQRSFATASILGAPGMLSGVINPGIFFAGGIDTNGVPVAETDFFSLRTATFDPGPALITARWQHQATQLEDKDNRVLITGGIDANGKVIATAEIYDPTTQTISNAGPMVFPRAGHVAVLNGDGTVLIVGGTGADGNLVADAELFDPGSATFVDAGKMIHPRIGHTALQIFDSNDNATGIFIAGGTDASGMPVPEAEFFPFNQNPAIKFSLSQLPYSMFPSGNPTNGTTFLSAGAMITPRTNHTAVEVFGALRTSNNQVLIAGGKDASGTVLSSSELYEHGRDEFLGRPSNVACAHDAYGDGPRDRQRRQDRSDTRWPWGRWAAVVQRGIVRYSEQHFYSRWRLDNRAVRPGCGSRPWLGGQNNRQRAPRPDIVEFKCDNCRGHRRRHSECNQRHRNGDPDSDADLDCDSNSYRHSNSYGHRDRDSNCNRYSDSDGHSDRDRNSDCDRNSNRDRNSNCDRNSAVVTWPIRSLFASSRRRASSAMAPRSATSPAGCHGLTPRRNSTSALYRLPIPARLA